MASLTVPIEMVCYGLESTTSALTTAPVPFRRRGDAWRRYWNPDGTVKS